MLGKKVKLTPIKVAQKCILPNISVITNTSNSSKPIIKPSK